MALPKHSPSVSFANDSVSYIVPTWSEMTDGIFEISQAIKKDGKNFDVIVTLAKGGFPLARMIADFLQMPTILSLGVHFYTGINQRLEKPEIYQEITPLTHIVGKNVLLFDDVADSGESLIFGSEHIMKLGAASVTTAALYMKPQTLHIPQYFAFTTEDWILFPFEVIESMHQLNERWKNQKISESERTERLIKIGCKKEWMS